MANFPDSKVSIIEILRAFHRWNPNDIRDLFVDEIISSAEDKNKVKINNIKILKDVIISIREKKLQQKIDEQKQLIDSLRMNIKVIESERVEETKALNQKIKEIDESYNHFLRSLNEYYQNLVAKKKILEEKYNDLYVRYCNLELEIERLNSIQNSRFNGYAFL